MFPFVLLIVIVSTLSLFYYPGNTDNKIFLKFKYCHFNIQASDETKLRGRNVAFAFRKSEVETSSYET